MHLHRRTVLQAGAIGLAGPSLTQLVRAEAGASTAKNVLFVFLTGGLSHQDSFDLKPKAPTEVRGEFEPIATATPGLAICEHLPLLAARSND